MKLILNLLTSFSNNRTALTATIVHAKENSNEIGGGGGGGRGKRKIHKEKRKKKQFSATKKLMFIRKV